MEVFFVKLFNQESEAPVLLTSGLRPSPNIHLHCDLDP